MQRLARLLERIAAEALAPLDLTPASFEVLAALRVQPAPHQLTPTDLYEAMLISSGGLTKLVKTLERRGLVTRPFSDDDRRSRPIALTAEGRALAEHAMLAVQTAEKPLHLAMEHAWPAAAGDMARGLAELADAADEAVKPAKGRQRFEAPKNVAPDGTSGRTTPI
ncbi:MarR family winged helix-turn-helix transcriptional regulator [Stutzerimonas chloritidismutans]|uniref:MarR family winged helix-turn-helix transcriptional regulator n=1 Tax=Stutzerimonas chloritidismutans TaxID=203192 RepID=UPI003F15EDCE